MTIEIDDYDWPSIDKNFKNHLTDGTIHYAGSALADDGYWYKGWRQFELEEETDEYYKVCVTIEYGFDWQDHYRGWYDSHPKEHKKMLNIEETRGHHAGQLGIILETHNIYMTVYKDKQDATSMQAQGIPSRTADGGFLSNTGITDDAFMTPAEKEAVARMIISLLGSVLQDSAIHLENSAARTYKEVLQATKVAIVQSAIKNQKAIMEASKKTGISPPKLNEARLNREGLEFNRQMKITAKEAAESASAFKSNLAKVAKVGGKALEGAGYVLIGYDFITACNDLSKTGDTNRFNEKMGGVFTDIVACLAAAGAGAAAGAATGSSGGPITFVAGAVVGLLYGMANYIVLDRTGKSIGEHIGAQVNKYMENVIVPEVMPAVKQTMWDALRVDADHSLAELIPHW